MISRAGGLSPEDQEIVFKILRGEIKQKEDLRSLVKEKPELTNNEQIMQNLTEQGFTPQRILIQ